MKTIVVIVLLALSAFSGFIYYKTDAVTLRDWREQLVQDGFVGSLKNVASGRLATEVKNTVNDAMDDNLASPSKSAVQIYKWTDAKGVVHYDNKPVKGAKTLTVEPNTNVLPMTKAADTTTPEKSVTNDAKQAEENIQKMRAAAEARAGI